ncbi:MAG TPA: hypothetical protein VFQ37_14425, partial [Mycobacterium sp.]|nr:hypothetical protein [Mycobacterium sp.]
MTMTAGTAAPLRRGLYGLLVSGLLTATVSTAIASPVVNAAPAQCDSTVGQSASEAVQSYLGKHPSVR